MVKSRNQYHKSRKLLPEPVLVPKSKVESEKVHHNYNQTNNPKQKAGAVFNLGQRRNVHQQNKNCAITDSITKDDAMKVAYNTHALDGPEHPIMYTVDLVSGWTGGRNPTIHVVFMHHMPASVDDEVRF